MIGINPFHRGELEVQQWAGEQAIASRVGNLVEKSVPAHALDFIRQQCFVWVGIDDSEGLLWAFPLFGSPGFINPNDGEMIEIELSGNFSIPDKWLNNLQKGKSIGCLVIEFSTRRRLRINGIIKEINARQLQIDVQQAYPNCSKYIRKREMPVMPGSCNLDFKSSGDVLNEQLENIINQADTAFVASLGPNGADVSHRGGPSGFIRCQSRDKIIVPDYQGNSMFNTLGNFQINPFGGIVVVDFDRGYFLQLSGTIKIIFDQEKLKTATGGTDRLWELAINKWQLFQLDNNIKWDSLDFSPHNP